MDRPPRTYHTGPWFMDLPDPGLLLPVHNLFPNHEECDRLFSSSYGKLYGKYNVFKHKECLQHYYVNRQSVDSVHSSEITSRWYPKASKSGEKITWIMALVFISSQVIVIYWHVHLHSSAINTNYPWRMIRENCSLSVALICLCCSVCCDRGGRLRL